MMRLKIFCSLVLSVSVLCVAGDNPTYEFLRSDMSARASAMAGSFVSMDGDPVGVFYNPASIGTVATPTAAFGYTSHLLDINSGYAAYSQVFEDLGVFGAGVNYVNYGTMDQTNDFGDKLGTFGAGDLAVSLSYANVLDENLYYGVTGKFIYSSIADFNSSALAADVGILYLIPGENPISLGASIVNVGKQLKAYVNTKEPLPLELKIGGTIKPQHLPLLLSINIRKMNEDQSAFIDRFNAFSVGGEFTLSKVLRFRFGYNNEQRKELKIGTSSGMAGFSLGGGLVMNKLRIDYSFSSLGKIGSISRISIGLDV
ncbi:MAG: type IX secretion system protein PorQ [Bacteroidota bacterium]|nr:type IX secretion system protein PorQ [Bacteroidota bacterium]